MKEETKTKNIRDLEYTRLISRENILVVLFGTFAISIFLTPLASQTQKIGIIFFIILCITITLFYFDKKLSKIVENIKGL